MYNFSSCFVYALQALGATQIHSDHVIIFTLVDGVCRTHHMLNATFCKANNILNRHRFNDSRKLSTNIPTQGSRNGAHRQVPTSAKRKLETHPSTKEVGPPGKKRIQSERVKDAQDAKQAKNEEKRQNKEAAEEAKAEGRRAAKAKLAAETLTAGTPEGAPQQQVIT
jgi:hypothetical protein